jgi:hypothetical protein
MDVLEHRRKVQYWLRGIVLLLEGRAKAHDESKLHEPEKAVYDEFTPKLKEVEYGSEQYKKNLEAMGEGLQHHYEANRHHPEHWENGVDGMTLVDLVEMFCDWLAAAERKQVPVDIDALAERFSLSPQLVSIFINTMRETDYWCEVNGVPIVYFTPESKRNVPWYAWQGNVKKRG